MNLDDLLGLCDLLKMDPGSIIGAYNRLQADWMKDDAVFLTSWLNAGEARNTTVSSILKMVVQGARDLNTGLSNLQAVHVELRNLHDDTRTNLRECRDSVRALTGESRPV